MYALWILTCFFWLIPHTAEHVVEHAAPKKHQVAAYFFAEWVGSYQKPLHFQGNLLAYETLEVKLVGGELFVRAYYQFSGKRSTDTKHDLREIYVLSYDRESRTGRFVSHATEPAASRPYPLFYYFLISPDGKQFAIKETDEIGNTTGKLMAYSKYE